MRNKLEKASFTVEAAIVLPVILFTLLVVIMYNFYLHDYVVTKSSTCSQMYINKTANNNLNKADINKKLLCSKCNIMSENEKIIHLKLLTNNFLSKYISDLTSIKYTKQNISREDNIRKLQYKVKINEGSKD